jgi:hypothetical protein
MEEKDFNESNDETRARGVKRTSEIKIAEVTTSKKKRAKKPTADATEPDIAQNLFEAPFERTEEYWIRISERTLDTLPVTWPKEILL